MVNTKFRIQRGTNVGRTDLGKINRGFKCTQVMFKLLSWIIDTHTQMFVILAWYIFHRKS